MPQEIINIGASPNDGTGDSLRDAFNKSNNNFTEVYTNISNNSTSLANLLKPELVFYASDYGAVGDGSTDDTAAIQAAIDAAGSALDAQQSLGYSGPYQVRLVGGTFLISSQLVVRNGITLIGETKNPPYPNRVSGFKSNNNLFTGTELLCTAGFTGENAILLEPDNTGVQDLILDGHFIEAGTTYPQVNVITSSGRFYTTRPMKLNVNDPNDFRINSFKFDNIEIPVLDIGECSFICCQGQNYFFPQVP